MLRIAICDDETTARDALRLRLEQVLFEGAEEIVYEFNSGKRAVRWLANHPGEIDLLFLDVEMDEMNGMEAAMEIRKFNSDIHLVFVTGYADYVYDGYKVGALDYVIKPASPEKLREVMTRVRDIALRQEEDFFSFQNIDGVFKINFRDIHYFYSEKRLVYLVTAQKKYAFYDKLDRVEERVSDCFVRIHQRYLVNPAFVDHISSAVVTIAGGELPISRGLKEEATKKLVRSMMGGEDF